jgi:membrane protein YqaA with SNARE-associated domain
MLVALIVAFIWGLAEASIFFVVPDVIISFIALKYGARAALLASLLAVVGAMAGGSIIYFLGQADLEGLQKLFDQLPAIGPEVIGRAHHEIWSGSGALTLLLGSITGVPFKLYASEAGAFNMPLWYFMLLTPLVRMPRFLMAGQITALIVKVAPARLLRHKYKILASFWLVFYALFWSLAPN